MKFTPMGCRVLVKADSPEEVLESGIILPDSAQERPNCGKIVATGPECTHLSVGESVMFIAWAGIKIKLNGEQHMVMAENEVLGLVEED